MYSTTLRSTYFTVATCVVQQRECQDWPKNQTAYWTIALTGLSIVQQMSVAGGQYLLNQPLVLCVMHWKIHKNTPLRDYVWLSCNDTVGFYSFQTGEHADMAQSHSASNLKYASCALLFFSKIDYTRRYNIY